MRLNHTHRRAPRYPQRAPALVEIAYDKQGSRVVRGTLSDVSRNGMGLRLVTEEPIAAPGTHVVIRFSSGGEVFSVPADVVWSTQESGDKDATIGVRLALKRARPQARKAFQRWTAEMEKSRSPGGLPAREQLECRLAALTGELEVLFRLVDGDDELDDAALHEADAAAERLQNAINALQLRSRR
jgi:hypothetical protein